jgi:hypothetical protein
LELPEKRAQKMKLLNSKCHPYHGVINSLNVNNICGSATEILITKHEGSMTD